MTMDAYWPGTKVLRIETPAGAQTALRAARAEGARAVVAAQLNDALAIASAAVRRAKERYFLGLQHFSPPMAALALEHANAARDHVDRLRGRIGELDCEPEPMEAPAPSGADVPAAPDSLIAVVSRELAATNAAIDRYRAIGAFVVSFDPAAQALLEEIVACEERHASALAGLLAKASAPYRC
jgi:bacterioferritin